MLLHLQAGAGAQVSTSGRAGGRRGWLCPLWPLWPLHCKESLLRAGARHSCPAAGLLGSQHGQAPLTIVRPLLSGTSGPPRVKICPSPSTTAAILPALFCKFPDQLRSKAGEQQGRPLASRIASSRVHKGNQRSLLRCTRLSCSTVHGMRSMALDSQNPAPGRLQPNQAAIEAMDPALQQLVETHAPYLSVGEGGRILCSLNGHQFPPRLDLVQSFVRWAGQGACMWATCLRAPGSGPASSGARQYGAAAFSIWTPTPPPPPSMYTPPLCSGAKYKKLVARAEAEAALPKYEPFLVPSLNFPDKLFCAVRGWAGRARRGGSVLEGGRDKVRGQPS